LVYLLCVMLMIVTHSFLMQNMRLKKSFSMLFRALNQLAVLSNHVKVVLAAGAGAALAGVSLYSRLMRTKPKDA
jgi:hypothetical protein